MNIQAEIDAARAGEITIVKPPSGTYMVDAVNAPITLKSHVVLDLRDGVTLQALPNDSPGYTVVAMREITNAALLGGTILGERFSHGGAGGEWGHGVGITNGSSSCRVDGVNVQNCWGDGIYIDGAKDILISNVLSEKNRRQGMSVIDVDGLTVEDSAFKGTGGTAPGAGIDLEVDDSKRQSIRNVVLRRNIFSGNDGAGLLIAVMKDARSNIVVDGTNSFEGQPIDGSDGVVPFYAKWLHQVFRQYWFYPHTISI